MAFADFKMAFADTYIRCFAVVGLLVSEERQLCLPYPVIAIAS
jgi:hypothetical protein